MTDQPQPPQQLPINFNISLPPDSVEGHYADFANIWHNDETFIFDFAVMVQPPQPIFGETAGGQAIAAQIDGQIVTRVRIPAAQAWELMKALEQQLSAWENEHPGKRLS